VDGVRWDMPQESTALARPHISYLLGQFRASLYRLLFHDMQGMAEDGNRNWRSVGRFEQPRTIEDKVCLMHNVASLFGGQMALIDFVPKPAHEFASFFVEWMVGELHPLRASAKAKTFLQENQIPLYEHSGL
jgi:hypothetical protein